ncbi:uncharacterized protein PHACADRAFT_33509 [Phanerochaete carnosa HHB-10118-sp]|uniref:Uncharacterized protein n=1 Tax=Phanerochaete carnosa (strain HHB-10118-sp) TaxID=650164 RepID=K5UIW4_PHACS|nr:uncharacterized protein PHACADRAFT_33509 [Phanerochaete carnosa HHB-10118-sp]EKM49481.1 hypothetical protein PHACADRAFT_33509 [Phanerochaete carnosa HHB-10118-sp]
MTEMYAKLHEHMNTKLSYMFDSTCKSKCVLKKMFMKEFEALKQAGTNTPQMNNATVKTENEAGEAGVIDEAPENTEDHGDNADEEIHPDEEDISLELEDL